MSSASFASYPSLQAAYRGQDSKRDLSASTLRGLAAGSMRRLSLATVLAGLGLWAAPSAQAKESRYQVKVLASPLKVGTTSQVKVQLTAQEPWHMNTEFPTSLKLSPASGLTLSQQKFKKKDARTLQEHKIVFAIPVKANEPGNFEVDGKLKFAICKKEACSPASAKVKLKLQALADTPTQTPKPVAKPKRSRPKNPRPQERGAPKRTPTQRPQSPAQKAAALPEGLEFRVSAWMLDPVLGPGATARVMAMWKPE